MEEKKQRNYNKEYQNEKNNVKRYVVKVPLYKAKILDEKLQEENKTYSSLALEAIEKYLKKN